MDDNTSPNRGATPHPPFSDCIEGDPSGLSSTSTVSTRSKIVSDKFTVSPACEPVPLLTHAGNTWGYFWNRTMSETLDCGLSVTSSTGDTLPPAMSFPSNSATPSTASVGNTPTRNRPETKSECKWTQCKGTEIGLASIPHKSICEPQYVCSDHGNTSVRITDWAAPVSRKILIALWSSVFPVHETLPTDTNGAYTRPGFSVSASLALLVSW